MVTTLPCTDSLQGMSIVENYGQRPWRVGKQEPPDSAREKDGIEAMQFKERTRAKHSQAILDFLNMSTGQIKIFNWPRLTAKLTVQVAEQNMMMIYFKGPLEILVP